MVLSKTLEAEDIPEKLRETVSLMSGTPEELAVRLGETGARLAYRDGGLTIQRVLAAGHLDELIITTLPVLIGQGIPLFGALGADIPLSHLSTEAYANGLVQSRYALRAD